MPAGITIQITGDGTGAAEALRAIEERMQQTAERGRQMGAEIAEGTQRINAEMERMVPRTAAASGAIREFEGTLPIRAVERFLSDTLGLGPALQAAFPLVGAIAFGEMLVRIGGEIKRVMDQSTAAAENTRIEWEKVNSALTVANDSLETKIDRTIAETDKLLGHPGANNLRVMFDEARDAADKLGVSISADLAKMQEVLSKKETSISFLGGMFTGKGSSSDTKALLGGIDADLEKAVGRYTDALSQAASSGDKGAVDKAHQASLADMQAAYDKAAESIRKLLEVKKTEQSAYDLESGNVSRVVLGYRDQTNNINLLEGALKDLEQQQRKLGLQALEQQADEQKTAAGDGGAKAREAARRQEELYARIDSIADEFAKKQVAEQQALASAKLKLDEAYETAQLQIAKSSASLQLTQLEQDHKSQMGSIADFLRSKLQIEESSLDAEAAIVEKQIARNQEAAEVAGIGTTKGIDILAAQEAMYARLNELSDARQKAESEITAQLQEQLNKEEQQKQEGARYLSEGENSAENKQRTADNKLPAEAAIQAAKSVDSFMTQLSEGAIKGKLSMKSLVDSALSDLDRFAMKLLEERSLIPLMNQLFGLNAGGPAGNGWSTPAEVQNALSVADTIPFDAAGGDIPDGGMAVVGDGGDGSGSELFAPKGPGTVLPHDVLEGIAKGNSGGGGSPNVTLNNINNTSNNVAMRQTSTTWDSDARQFVINTVLEDMQSGGPTRQAMGMG